MYKKLRRQNKLIKYYPLRAGGVTYKPHPGRIEIEFFNDCVIMSVMGWGEVMHSKGLFEHYVQEQICDDAR